MCTFFNLVGASLNALSINVKCLIWTILAEGIDFKTSENGRTDLKEDMVIKLKTSKNYTALSTKILI